MGSLINFNSIGKSVSGYSGYSGKDITWNWKGPYFNGEGSYEVNDLVSYNGKIYICIIAHETEGGSESGGENDYWELFLQCISGDSGYSGKSGYSGYSGISGYSGTSAPYVDGYLKPTGGYKSSDGTSGVTLIYNMTIYDDIGQPLHQIGFKDGILTYYQYLLECCFLAGTKILMENNECKNIEDIIIGDKIIGGIVESLENPIRDHYYYIVFENDLVLKMTDEHPIMTNNGWASINPQKYKSKKLEVKKLELGNHVKTVDGYLQIIGWIKVLGDIQTYNLSKVSPSETFYANGFLVHNKCLEGNTLIETAANPICIKDIKIGDSVFGIKDGKEIITEVINIYCKETLNPLPGRIYDGFACTENHKFLNNNLNYDKINIDCKTYDLKTKCGSYILSNGLISINDENEIFGNF
jgi:hypothetical protein